MSAPPRPPRFVTAICPTTGRGELIGVAISSFLSQTYKDSELLIVDDGVEPLKLEPHPRIRYVHIDTVHDIGTKRNLCCDMARGEVIFHWDSDDYSVPTRMVRQLSYIHESCPLVTGYHGLSFYDMPSKRAYRIVSGLNAEGISMLPLAMGTSLAYDKRYWKANPFPAVAIGEDVAFVARAKELRQLHSENGVGMMVVRRHAGNTSNDFAVGTTIRMDQLPAGFPI